MGIEYSMKKVIIYYTNNRLDKNIAGYCFDNLLSVAKGIPVVVVAQKDDDYLNTSSGSVFKKIVGPQPRMTSSIFVQLKIGLQTALEKIQPDIVYTAEHDILYSPGYFDFYPANPFVYYYGNNIFWMDKEKFVDTKKSRHLSNLACHFSLLMTHINWRLYRLDTLNIPKAGLTKCEPGCSAAIGAFGFPVTDPTGLPERRKVELPVIDIRHGRNTSHVVLSKFIERFGSKVFNKLPFWGEHSDLKRKMNWK